MKLEYLPDGSPDCPLVRLYDFTPADAEQFLSVVSRLASDEAERVEVHDLPFVEPVGGCQLAMVRRPWDQAVVRVGPAAFECGFLVGTWGNVVGLIKPFAEGAGGFQWLARSPGEASLLLSVSGEW